MSKLRKFVVVTGAFALWGAVVTIAGPAPEVQASTCPSGWVAVGSDACELVVTSTGPVTLPAGVTQADVAAAARCGRASDWHYRAP